MPDPKEKKLTNSEKWWIAIAIAILYIVFASGPAFAISNELLSPLCFQTFYGRGGPTLAGILLHAVLVALIIRLGFEASNL